MNTDTNRQQPPLYDACNPPPLCRNAYIMAAVHGGGFCSSAQLAVKTIVTNVLRVAAVDTVGDALVFLGKLSVMAGAGGSLLLSPLQLLCATVCLSARYRRDTPCTEMRKYLLIAFSLLLY